MLKMLVKVKPMLSSHSHILIWKQIFPVYKQKLLGSPVIANNVKGIEIKLKANESKDSHLQSKQKWRGGRWAEFMCRTHCSKEYYRADCT